MFTKSCKRLFGERFNFFIGCYLICRRGNLPIKSTYGIPGPKYFYIVHAIPQTKSLRLGAAK